MSAVSSRASLRAAGLVAAVLVAACSGRSTSTDDALHRDLNAASGDGLALAPRGTQTQVVSPLELANGGKVAPAGVPARPTTPAPAAPQRLAARELPPRIITRVRYVDRVVERAPAPARREVVAAAPAPAPEPAPVVSEPAPVAAPSPGSRHYPEPVDGRDGRGRHARQGRAWDMGDVMRNAPFPINP